MQRNELITITAVSSNCETVQAEKIIDAFLDTIILALKTQDTVELRTDFGSFIVRLKGGASETKNMPIRKVERIVSFKATRTFKRKLKQSDEEYIQALKEQGAELQIERLKHQ